MITGKAFEYALLLEFENRLKYVTNCTVIKNSSFNIAKKCFEEIGKIAQSEYMITASSAVNFLVDIEPRLSNGINTSDVLQLEIMSDNQGKKGDVRDVLAIRVLQKWEIGVSAKNNHEAVKHSRLSAHIDFGEKWLDTPVSKKYFKIVTPIFNELEKIKKESSGKRRWSELGDYHTTIYIPILKAFVRELKSLSQKKSVNVASNLVTYLVGNKDFYKVIKRKGTLEIQAYNLRGTLNLPFKNISPKFFTPRVPLPKKIIKVDFKKGSDTTAIIAMDNNWTLSFRIHNASSKVESSLKFDIKLLKTPTELFKNTLSINYK